MRIFGGYWDDIGKSEYRKVHKYGLDPKWMLERWRPASIYGTPELWNAQTITPDGYLACGPFPAHGEYECATKFSIEKGMSGYVPLEPGLVELTARMAWADRVVSYSDLREINTQAALAKERAADQKFDDMWADAQATRPGLTIGYGGGAVNKQQEIDDYVRRLEKSNAFVDSRKFQHGFRQQ